jgi:hypothetical protein
LPGNSDHEHVGGNGIAHQRAGQTLRFDEMGASRPDPLLDGAAQPAGREREIGIAGKVARKRLVEIGKDV